MAANGQAKDLGLVVDEGEARFDVAIRRHFGWNLDAMKERLNLRRVLWTYQWNKESPEQLSRSFPK